MEACWKMISMILEVVAVVKSMYCNVIYEITYSPRYPHGTAFNMRSLVAGYSVYRRYIQPRNITPGIGLGRDTEQSYMTTVIEPINELLDNLFALRPLMLEC